ncbi:MAG: HNH endonuclease, partial [Candidatus Binatia bacterium]
MIRSYELRRGGRVVGTAQTVEDAVSQVVRMVGSPARLATARHHLSAGTPVVHGDVTIFRLRDGVPSTNGEPVVLPDPNIFPEPDRSGPLLGTASDAKGVPRSVQPDSPDAASALKGSAALPVEVPVPGFEHLPWEEDAEGDFVEGAVREVVVNAFERDRRARAACIAHYACACQVYGFDFERAYGTVASGLIHVHH